MGIHHAIRSFPGELPGGVASQVRVPVMYGLTGHARFFVFGW
jgi:hypothetical protein